MLGASRCDIAVDTTCYETIGSQPVIESADLSVRMFGSSGRRPRIAVSTLGSGAVPGCLRSVYVQSVTPPAANSSLARSVMTRCC